MYSTNGITEEELEEAQRLNLEIYLNQLKSIIINFKLWMIYRLRLWRWREEVLLGNVGLTLESYPGLVMMFDFESSADIMENGFHNYYMRAVSYTHLVGSCEILSIFLLPCLCRLVMDFFLVVR